MLVERKQSLSHESMAETGAGNVRSPELSVEYNLRLESTLTKR